MSPRVSVCMPSYEAERFVARTVESVVAQTYTDWELIVVDDASQDSTYELVRALAAKDARIRVERNDERLGATGNWNRALSRASAPYVKLLCSDDVLAPDCLARSVAALDRWPTAALVGGPRDVIDADGRLVLPSRGGARCDEIVDGRRLVRRIVRLATTPLGEPSFQLMRREALASLGPEPFRRDYGYIFDVDLTARLLRHHDGAVLGPPPLGGFRLSGGQLSAAMARQQGAEARRLLRDLAADPVFGISRSLLAAGLLRTHAVSRARRAVLAAAVSRARRRRG